MKLGSHVDVVRKLIVPNKFKKKKEESLYQYHHTNYSTPLTSQVGALDVHSINLYQCLHNLESNTYLAKQPEKVAHFNLSPDYISKIVQNGVETRTKKKQCPPKMGRCKI